MAILEIGQKINHLTVISFSHKDSKYRKFYNVRCDCGKEKVVNGNLITSGNTRSCGCFFKKMRADRFKLPDNKGVINQVKLGYLRHARDRSFNWELEDKDFEVLIKSNCYYCGIEPNNKKITKSCKEGFMYNGIDRVNSHQHYTKENTVACCAVCNRAKRDMSQETFLNWIKRVYNNQFNTP